MNKKSTDNSTEIRDGIRHELFNMLCTLAIISGANYYKKHMNLLENDLKRDPANRILLDIKNYIAAI